MNVTASNITRRKNSARTPWYIKAFGEDYLLRYQHRSEEAARNEAAFARSVLKLRAGAQLLDLCCGNGRHSRAFQSMGINVAAIDRSADLLRAAQRHVSPRGKPPISYILADMRRLPLAAARFHAVVSMFTSFGYFTTDRENARVLHEVARVLKPGAFFLLDYFNIKRVLKDLVPYSEKQVGSLLLRERRRYHAGSKRLMKTIRVAGTRDTLRESVRAYTPAELKRMFAKAGLKVVRLYGDLSGAEFDAKTSMRCVVLAQKLR